MRVLRDARDGLKAGGGWSYGLSCRPPVYLRSLGGRSRAQDRPPQSIGNWRRLYYGRARRHRGQPLFERVFDGIDAGLSARLVLIRGAAADADTTDMHLVVGHDRQAA